MSKESTPMATDPVDQAIEVLNRINDADPTVLRQLFAYRVGCSEAIADDPTVQVKVKNENADPDGCSVHGMTFMDEGRCRWSTGPGPGECRLPLAKDDPFPFMVGLLGIINGLFGVDEKGFGFITAMYDAVGNIKYFERTTHSA